MTSSDSCSEGCAACGITCDDALAPARSGSRKLGLVSVNWKESPQFTAPIVTAPYIPPQDQYMSSGSKWKRAARTVIRVQVLEELVSLRLLAHVRVAATAVVTNV